MRKKILILAAALIIVGFVGKVFCFPITVKDDPGREVTISEPPQRIAEAGPVELGEIVVTASRRPQLLADVPVSTTIVTREDIETTNALDVAKAIQQTAGVKVNSYGAMGAAATVTLRGSVDKQVLVLVDGMPVNTTSLGTADLSMYPTDNIEKIEIVRGPFSALYGANALGGVVNIITQNAPEKQRIEFNASYGEYQTHVYQLSYGNKLRDIGYFLTLSDHRSDGHRKNSDCQGYNLTGKLSWDFGSRSKLSLSTGYSEQEKGVPGSILYLSPNARQDDKRSWADLTYKRSGNRSNLLLKAYLNRDWGNYRDPGSWGGPTDDVNINSRLGLNLQQDINLNLTNILTWGIDLQNDRADIDAISEEKKLTNYAVYIQDELNLLDSLVITPGLRYDHHDIYGNEVNPRLSCLFQLSEQTDLKASVGRAFRAPTVNDLYWDDAYGKGNPDLRSEKSIGYEFGVNHQFSPKFLGHLTLFRNEVDDLITWDDPDGDGIWQPYNIGKARLEGIEAEAKAKPGSHFSVGFTYTYLQARDKETDKYLKYKPKHKVGLSLGYESTLGLKINMSADYTDHVFSNALNTKKLDSYTLLNACITQQLGQNVELFCSGGNLLDEKYQLYKDYPMPGLNISGGIKARF